jgi:hypothetical protein
MTATTSLVVRWLHEVVADREYPTPDDIIDFTPGARGCEVAFRETPTTDEEEEEDEDEKGHVDDVLAPPRMKRRRSTRPPVIPPSVLENEAALLMLQSPPPPPSSQQPPRRHRHQPPKLPLLSPPRSGGIRLCYVPTHIAAMGAAGSPVCQRCFHEQQQQLCKAAAAAVATPAISKPLSKPWTSPDDAMIRRRFLLVRGALRPAAYELAIEDLAEDLSRPADEIRKRALFLGLVPVKAPR